MTARILCALTYNSSHSQRSVCECEFFNFTPVAGKVTLNALPEALKRKLNHDPSE